MKLSTKKAIVKFLIWISPIIAPALLEAQDHLPRALESEFALVVGYGNLPYGSNIGKETIAVGRVRGTHLGSPYGIALGCRYSLSKSSFYSSAGFRLVNFDYEVLEDEYNPQLFRYESFRITHQYPLLDVSIKAGYKPSYERFSLPVGISLHYVNIYESETYWVDDEGGRYRPTHTVGDWTGSGFHLDIDASCHIDIATGVRLAPFASYTLLTKATLDDPTKQVRIKFPDGLRFGADVHFIVGRNK